MLIAFLLFLVVVLSLFCLVLRLQNKNKERRIEKKDEKIEVSLKALKDGHEEEARKILKECSEI